MLSVSNRLAYLKLTASLVAGSEVKASARNEGDLGSIPGSGRSPGEENGNPFCLENPVDRGAWWAMVHGVAKSQTQLSNFTEYCHRKLKIFSAPSSTALLY